jgi:hypothetical protein
MTITVDHAGPVNSIHTEDGRWYVHPTTDERFMSVTTALKACGKESLVPWASGLTAVAAFAELPTVVAASRVRPCGRTWNRCTHDWYDACDTCPCGNCRTCVTRWLADRHLAESARRADEGTRVHHAIDQWVLAGGQWPQTDDDLAPFLAAFRLFVADYGLTPASWEMSEGTVISRQHGYAGTLDGDIRVRAADSEAAADLCARLGKTGADVLVRVDTKTRGKPEPKIYKEHALQLAGYEHAEAVLLPDGAEVPLPAVDGCAVLQLRPDGYTLRPVVTGPGTFAAFLHALNLYRWQVEDGADAVSVSAFPLPEDYKRARTNRRARERRAAARNTKTTIAPGRVPSTRPDGEPTPSRVSDHTPS